MKKKNASGNARRLLRKTRATIINPKQPSMRETIGKIHHAVILIENDHGSALKAIGEGLSLTNELLDRFKKDVNQRFDVMDRRLSSVEVKVIELSDDVKEIKQNTSHTASIVDDHEVRLGTVESSIKEHIEKHA
jgi:SMC interacting uncharacterized protein involved in chromosome segregation